MSRGDVRRGDDAILAGLGRRVRTMKDGKTKGTKTVSGPGAGKFEAGLRPLIDPALLKDVGDFVDDPEGWFYIPNAEFEGRMPIELLGNDEEARLRNRIEAAKLGMFS
jgi:hypothetical protein